MMRISHRGNERILKTRQEAFWNIAKRFNKIIFHLFSLNLAMKFFNNFKGNPIPPKTNKSVYFK